MQRSLSRSNSQCSFFCRALKKKHFSEPCSPHSLELPQALSYSLSPTLSLQLQRSQTPFYEGLGLVFRASGESVCTDSKCRASSPTHLKSPLSQIHLQMRFAHVHQEPASTHRDTDTYTKTDTDTDTDTDTVQTQTQTQTQTWTQTHTETQTHAWTQTQT